MTFIMKTFFAGDVAVTVVISKIVAGPKISAASRTTPHSRLSYFSIM